jgi:hypothetical protein
MTPFLGDTPLVVAVVSCNNAFVVANEKKANAHECYLMGVRGANRRLR